MPRVRKIARPTNDAPASPPPGFPPITRGDVAAWVGEAALRRGMPYVEDALFDARRSQRTLKANCQGSAVQPYRVSVTFGERGIASDDCSCPVGNNCKHVAALLVAWIDDPDMFVEVESTDAALERRDKAELIALIRRMLARNPELETLLELPTPGATKTPRPLDPARIRYQVAAAFRSAGDDWYGASRAADALQPLLQLGDDYVQAGDWQNSVIVFHTIAHGIGEHYEEVQDEGELGDVIEGCVEGLVACLDGATERMQRESLLRALFDIYRWDVEQGGYGLGDSAEAALLEHASGGERRLLTDWLREIPPARSASSWRSEAIGRFILKLTGDDLDDETFLEVGREHGLQRQIIERLLARNRYDEAEAEVRRAQDYQLLSFADLLREAGRTEQSERIVREHQPAGQFKPEFTRWLRDRARERGDDAAALALTEALFDLLKTPDVYDELRAAAEKTGRWNQLRPLVIARLKRDQQYNLLTEIYLRDHNIGEALIALRQTRAYAVASSGESLRLKVASAAEAEKPRDAIALYCEVAEQYIAAKGRESYISAAKLLARVRQLYTKLKEPAAWDALIADIRLRHKSLRALKEELERARL